MPIHFPTSEFFENSGNQASSFMEQLRDQTADFACELWSLYPRYITEGKSLGASFARGYMNSMCQGRVTLPAYPAPPFAGGQCEGVEYEVLLEAETFYYNDPRANQTARLVLYGAIENITVVRPLPGNPPSIIGFFAEGYDQFGDPYFTGKPIGGSGWTANLISIQINRLDGQVDSCGDPDTSYPSPDPTSSDLTTVINIDLPDGAPFTANLTYNQLAPTFNFPMGFRINGVNISLDVSGITIYGADEYISPSGNNDVLPPGGAGGGDGVGGGDLVVHPKQDHPVVPSLENPKPEEVSIENIVCEEGVAAVTTSILKVAGGMGGWVSFVSAALNVLLTALCEDEGGVVVGFPEYYDVLPGSDRPAIVYLYKTLTGNKWGSSTYTSTASHPTQGAIDEIETLLPPPRELGKFVATLRLADGSRAVTTGSDNGVALVNLLWLLARIEPSYIPSDHMDKIVISQHPLLQEKIVRLRAIEYYPDGAGTNRTPEIRRYIDADEYS